MPSDGEYFITSKGRKFYRGLQIDMKATDFLEFNPYELEEPYQSVGSPKELPGEEYNFPIDDSHQPRTSDLDTLRVLEDLREGPVTYDPGWTLDTLEWLAKHGYAKFVSFKRSQDVNFKTKLSKFYEVK